MEHNPGAEGIPARNDTQICEPWSHTAPGTASRSGGQESESHPERIGEPPVINTAEPPSPARDGMAWIPGGDFSMGSEDAWMPDAPALGPAISLSVSSISVIGQSVRLRRGK